METKKLFDAYHNIPPTYNSIDNQRLKLIPLTKILLKKYFDDLWEYSKISMFYDFLEYPPIDSRDECYSYFDSILSSLNNKQGMLWLIFLAKEKKVIGTIRLTHWDLYRKNTQVGYGISPRYGRKGYFTEALSYMIDYTFNILGFYRIESWTRADNIGSIKGLEKLGFAYEGCLRKHNLKYNGTRHDVVIYSLLNTDKIQ